MVQPKALSFDKGDRGWQAVWPRHGFCMLLLLEPRGAILGAETSHYTAAGISGLNSSADCESVDCIFYRIPIENAKKTGQNNPSAVWI